MNSITTIQTLATSKKLFRHSSNNGIYICRSFKLRFEGPCCTHSEVPRSCIQSKDGIHLTLFPWLNNPALTRNCTFLYQVYTQGESSGWRRRHMGDGVS